MDQWLEEIRAALPELVVYQQEPMKKHTTFRVGGPADLYVCPKKQELPVILGLAKKKGHAVTVIGNGSNLLVGDKGYRGVILQNFGDKARERKQSDHVRDHHDAVEEVGKFPNQRYVEEGAEHQEAQNKHAVALHPAQTEEILDVLFAEEVPADDRRKGEEKEADRNEARTDVAQTGCKGGLREDDAGALAVKHASRENDECGHVEHNEGVKE